MIKYICDCCNKEIKDSANMMDLQLTTRNIPLLRSFSSHENFKIELLCIHCCVQIIKLVKDFNLRTRNR